MNEMKWKIIFIAFDEIRRIIEIDSIVNNNDTDSSKNNTVSYKLCEF